MSEHEPEYASGQCSQGCGRLATTKFIKQEHGLEVHYPYCQECQDQEIKINLALDK